ncbi:D-alanine aminotransferase [Fictibacillus macauensis ZFHKF-1]|uniref:D-alanine aminotransferase n=1 Tax=Fictibacillus macauensis ZFHKF-1 TaxID=1196324 RepID=I8ALK9_9BACL|nr:D-amino-acid transaminase [Fictibacillus macauensis]EIT86802.1 D-alanine aminotransferase [Fictibacillus macauensis ZFHKF-1]
METKWVLYGTEVVERDKVSIDLEDRGYNFGDGIYEVISIHGGKPFALRPHFLRFVESARKMQIALPCKWEDIAMSVEELLRKTGVQDGIVYIQMTRGVSQRNHVYTHKEQAVITGFARSTSSMEEEQTNGMACFVTEDLRWLRCDIKSLNLLGNIMAKRQAADEGCQEAILHRQWQCTEGSASNVFIVKNGIVYTHEANHYILNGITRQYVLSLAQKLNITVREEAFSLAALERADEVFCTSTSLEVAPVVEVKGDIQATYEIGQVTKTLQQALQQVLFEEVNA